MLLGRGLMAAGFQIVLVSDGESRVPEYNFERYSAAGFICRKVTFPGPNLNRQAVNRAISSTWQVNSLVQSVYPDLIHVHFARSAAPGAPLRAELQRLAAVEEEDVVYQPF